MTIRLTVAAGLAALALPHALFTAQAQSGCKGSSLAGTVMDSTRALVPGAGVSLDGGQPAASGPDGGFRFACVASGAHTLTVTADGFGKRETKVLAPHSGVVEVTLQPEADVVMDVDGEAESAKSTTAVGPTQTIEGSRLQSLADDPDDLLRELQQMAANAGALPGNVTIAVDGFKGASSLPPKSSIAYIKVNPDMFSSEYREPPFDGGRVEVYTKPGQKTFHGALFATNGSSWMNARDPFSVSRAALGKQRYGFELSGPVRQKGSDFAMTLEHRSIDNFAVVNAVTGLDGAGNFLYTLGNVPTPQRLWLGTARVDWQIGPRNTFIVSYSANQNHLANLGVGGQQLSDTGYDSGRYDHALRFTNVTTASAHLMHESRLALRWDGETDSPLSTAPQVQVAGAFTKGGATLGPRRLQEFNIEWDDDAILTTKKHTMKFGTQFMFYNEHQQLTTNFNGSYTFGGVSNGTAPVLDTHCAPTGQTQSLTGLQQYLLAQQCPAQIAPTAYTSVTGTPVVNFTQVKNALFFQDDWDIGHGIHVATGLRYLAETSPTILSTITPRLGVAWAPTKDGKWTLHGHAGLFSGENDTGTWGEVLREDGVHRITRTAYNPVYGSNNPFAGTTPIYSQRAFNPHISEVKFFIENFGGTRSLPGGWNLSVDWYGGRIWNEARSPNINSPLNGSPTGPRALGITNTNILQVQNSGQGHANVEFVSLENHKSKYVQGFIGSVHIFLVDDSDDHSTFSPQSAFTNAGEIAQRTNNGAWQVFGNATVNLPKKVQFSTNLQVSGDAHYNITTGLDNNGDGNFNDRPQYALPGQANAVQTPWGLLVASGGTGVFGRNRGVLPWQVYLDANLQRAFPLTRNKKAEHPQSLLINVRSSNVLNHLNVTAVGGVLGSPLFGMPYSGDNGRRVEAGVRYSF